MNMNKRKIYESSEWAYIHRLSSKQCCAIMYDVVYYKGFFFFFCISTCPTLSYLYDEMHIAYIAGSIGVVE